MPSKKRVPSRVASHPFGPVMRFICSVLLGALFLCFIVLLLWLDKHELVKRGILTDGAAVYAEQIANLQNQIEQLTQQNTDLTSSVVSSTKRVAFTGTIVNEQKLRPEENLAGWNQDPASVQVKYTDAKKGLSFLVPYHPAWGSGQYYVHPVDVRELDGQGLAFGSFDYICAEGCGWYRQFRLLYIPARTQDAALKEFQKEAKENPEYPHTSKVSKVNGLTVIHYTIEKLEFIGEASWYEVIGKKANYVIGPGNGFNPPTDEQILEIIKTMQLVP